MAGNVTCSWVVCLRSFCAAIRLSAAFLRSASDSMGHPPRLSDPVTVRAIKSKGTADRASRRRAGIPNGLVRLSIALLRLHLLDLLVGESQHARQRRTHWRYVVSKKRKPQRQHPDAENRQEAEHAATGQSDPRRYTYPYGLRLSQTAEIPPRPVGHVALEPVHFLVKIGLVTHARSKALAGICSVASVSASGRS